ncbi:MAG: hypothetical protein ACTSPA_02760 [Promethearchaeota archaeon]
MSQNHQQKMYKLGLAMEEYRKFFWMGICLFFFIIPPFILFWKYIKFIIALNDVRELSPQNENLKYGFFSLVIGFALPFATAAFGTNSLGISSGFSILAFISVIFGWVKLEQWGEDLYRERNTSNMAQLKDGFKDIKTAQILTIIFFGIFMIPGAFEKAGTALIREFGPQRQSAQRPQYNQTQQPQYGQTQQPQYSQTQQPQYDQTQKPQFGQTQQPLAQSPEKPSICSQCGVSIPSDDIKFCGSCGYKF